MYRSEQQPEIIRRKSTELDRKYIIYFFRHTDITFDLLEDEPVLNATAKTSVDRLKLLIDIFYSILQILFCVCPKIVLLSGWKSLFNRI